MISTKGTVGECHVELPHNTELIETFQCKKEAKSKYLLPHIKPAMKAMFCSNKVSLRTNEAGLLCFQYMIKTDDGTNCFIEYYVSFYVLKFNRIEILRENKLVMYIHKILLQISPLIDEDDE